MHGAFTSIVDEREGIIHNKVRKCEKDNDTTIGCNGNPNVPDFKQLTGMLTVFGTWTPLYGKVNIVSEADINLEFFLLGGIGINGTREAVIDVEKGFEGKTISSQDFGDGGFLDNPKFHATFGVGAKVFVTPWMSLRADFRGIAFPDEFVFDNRDIDSAA